MRKSIQGGRGSLRYDTLEPRRARAGLDFAQAETVQVDSTASVTIAADSSMSSTSASISGQTIETSEGNLNVNIEPIDVNFSGLQEGYSHWSS